MKYTKMLAGVAALGLLVFNATVTQAAQKLVFDVKLNIQSQGIASTNGSSQKFNVDKTKGTTQDLLGLLAEHYDTTYPAAAELVLVDNGTFVVYSSDPNKGGSVLTIVEASVLKYSESVAVYQEKSNSSNGSYNGTRNFVMTLEFHDGVNNMTLSGYATDTYSGNDQSGNYKRSIRATVAGTGTDSQGALVVNGSATAKGDGSSS